MSTIDHHGIEAGEPFIERAVEGQPYRGKVLAAVQAHADDIPYYCGGTVAKLVSEGYTAYLIQTTNDEKCGPTPSIGRTVWSNEEDVEALAQALGFKAIYNLGYRNHRLDEASPTELRGRLIYLFRLLRVDTVLTFNPWGHDEENPDHTVTGQAVEAACWMGGMDKDYPEHLAGGLKPQRVTQRYYWVGREGQPYNRVVDISPWIETKVAAISTNKSQGPGGSRGSRLRAELAARGLRLPALDGSDEDADRAYIRLFQLDEYRNLGRAYGLEAAEAFYYLADRPSGRLEAYIREHAVPLT